MRKGFTLLEVLVVIVMIAIAALLLIPMSARSRTPANRTICANNLNQFAKAMFMYADAPGNNDFPCVSKDGDKADPMASLGLLYNKYIQDPRAFSCPSRPVAPAALAAMKPGGPVVSSYGYDPHHGPNDAIAAIAADFKGAGENSDHHGPNAGQNVMMGAGNVEFLGSSFRRLGQDAGGEEQFDPDIFSLNPEIPREVDGFIRQK